MFSKRFFPVFSFFLSWFLVTGSSSISGQSYNIPINLFDRDLNLVIHNSHESYVLITIDDLENNFRNTITRAPSLPAEVLTKAGVCDFVTPTHICTLVVNKDFDALGESTFHQHVKTKQGIHILGKLKVNKSATFKNDVTVNGTLSAADVFIGSLSVTDIVIGDVTISGILSVNNEVIKGNLII